jgi:predicted lipoprotein with Yx(FWY)xxD motif
MRGAKLVLLGAVTVLVLAACSNGNDTSGSGGGATGSGGEQSSGAEVATATSDLGTILTDATGRTLYLFENDTSPESTCYQDCASSWPAFTTSGDPVAGSGIDASLLGTAERTDGTVQVTYNGHPLYFFGGDQAAGDTNGQEVGDVWYVVSPKGEAVEAEEDSGGEQAASGGKETEVQAEDSSLGTILTDRDGNTLYLFENDADGESTCYGDCAASWPAFEAKGDPAAGDGVDASLLGTTERTDGTVQVTYNGHPLYYFGGDQAAGDTNGQEIGDVWYVVSPEGDAVEG